MTAPRSALILGVALALATPLSPATAQQRPAPRAPAAPTQPAPPPQETPAPYEPDLLRLAEVIGALSHLREVCDMKDGDAWRARMAALVATEGTTPQRQERLAGAFNRGFRTYADIHRACAPAARLLIERFVQEGAKLSRDLANRYSG